jgi:hypothetical protein
MDLHAFLNQKKAMEVGFANRSERNGQIKFVVANGPNSTVTTVKRSD